jgi:hypothetical protein
MTDILKHERRIYTDNRPATATLAIVASPAGPRTLSPFFRWLQHCCSFLGYTIVIGMLVGALLEFVSWAIWSVHPITRQAALENQIGSPVYAGVDWAQEFWQEESARRKKTTTYVPFRIWGVASWHSKYINNDEGVGGFWRRTINPANCDAPRRVTVWTFGGSTMYGTAVPDWATIPSYLSREMNAGTHDCVVVFNYGVEGYVTDQELILLGEQLKAGGHPDIVIFYDGVNDSSLAWPPPGPPSAHFSYRMIKKRVEGSVSGRLDFLQKSYSVRLVSEALSRFGEPHSFASLVSAAQPNVLATLSNYEANMRLARALAAAYKFKLYCFWQPMLVYGDKPFVPFEQQMATRDASGNSADSAWFLTNAAVYREAELHAARDGNFVFLGHLFNSTKDPVYVDEAHLGPRGNEIAAQAIARYIQDHPEE